IIFDILMEVAFRIPSLRRSCGCSEACSAWGAGLPMPSVISEHSDGFRRKTAKNNSAHCPWQAKPPEGATGCSRCRGPPIYTRGLDRGGQGNYRNRVNQGVRATERKFISGNSLLIAGV